MHALDSKLGAQYCVGTMVMVQSQNNLILFTIVCFEKLTCTFTVRRDQLNSQFIVTEILILHVGGRSFFIFQSSRECWKAMLEPQNCELPPSN